MRTHRFLPALIAILCATSLFALDKRGDVLLTVCDVPAVGGSPSFEIWQYTGGPYAFGFGSLLIYKDIPFTEVLSS